MLDTPLHSGPASGDADVREAEKVLRQLAAVFDFAPVSAARAEESLLNPEAKYRTLVEQLPAVVFMGYLDQGTGEAYVSPRIEEALGFTQAEWLEDPVRWYRQIHPDDRQRWSDEAADLLLTGNPLRSAYRVLARDGRVLWFQCEVKLVRRADGHPWFLHGVGFDITDRKRAEEKILDSLREKEALLKEIHHRVKNNLAVISSLFYLQSSYTRDEQTMTLLKESQDRVRSMAMVHELLYRSENLASVDFSHYAASLSTELLRTYGIPPGRIRLSTDLQPVSMEIDQAVPCGLILNELVTNALKHAHPGQGGGTIRVSLRLREDRICLIEVGDDGAGLPNDFDAAGSRSFGLRLIRTLARQLDGEIEFAALRPGTLARLTFSLDRHA